MALQGYYGLRNYDTGEIIEKGWSEDNLPVLNLYMGDWYFNYGAWWHHCYANVSAGIRTNDTEYHSGFPIGPAWGNVPTDGNITMFSSYYGSSKKYYKVKNQISGYTPQMSVQTTVGSIVYDINSSKKYVIVPYYKFTVSASTNSVDGTQVGNIALYNGSTLVVGSVSKKSESTAVSSFNWSITTESTSLSLKFVATARTSAISNWHNQYFFNKITKDSSDVADRDVVFSSDTVSYSFTLSNKSAAFVVDYGKKHKLSIVSVASGVSSAKISYTRTHGDTSYVSNSTSPISLTGKGDLYIEEARLAKFEASCSPGFVFGNANGFISTKASGGHNYKGSGSSSITFTNCGPFSSDEAWDVTATSYQISVSISDESKNGWGTVYIDNDNPRVTSKRLVQGTTYNFHFESSKDGTVAPVVDYWTVGGQRIQGSSYTASELSGNVVVACVLKQTAWPVTVESGSSGTATVIGRYRKIDGASIPVGYLYANGSDYIKISVTPNDHFEETVSDRVVNNLEEYSAGGAYAYSLESELDGYIKFYFNRAECVIRTQIGNSGLPIPDANIIDNVLPQSTTRRYDAEDVTCLLSCTIKEQYDGLYRCDYWTVGGVQKPNEGASGTSMFYLTIYPTDWQNVTDLVCIPHLVSTSNQLTVTKSGRSDLATVYVKPSASEPEESMSGSSYSKLIREHAQVDIRAVAAFGGIVATPTYEDIENPDVTESSIGFQMPSNDCSVDFAVSERTKIQLGLQLANGTDNTLVGKIILTAPGSAAVHEEVFGTNQVIPFTIYQNTSYTLTATDDDDTYQFTGWYLNGSPVSEELSITISRSQNAVYVARYTMRASGTIGINYGIKSGDDVNPTELPEESSPFGLVIDTPPDQTDPDKWVIGRTKYISFHVTDNGIEEVAGTGPNSGIFIWTPVRVEVKEDIEADVYTTVWTYDELNPDARSGRFVMRNNMLVRTVYTRVKAEGQARVRALFMGGTNGEMGQLSIFSTNMPSYYSLGGEAEAVCATGRKVVLAASVKPGYAFVGWFEVVEGEFVPVESNGAILTVSSLSSQGCTYYAGFARSSSGVKAWNDDENPKVFEWRSKVYVGAQFFALRNLRIYSDVYPVTITLMTATSPNGCFTPSARTLTMQITNQSPRLIPVMRLEKYFAFKVNGTGRINHIAIASGMEAMK